MDTNQNPILFDIPTQILTPRLLLRPSKAGDGRMVNEGIHESLASLSPWMPWVKTPPTVEDSELKARESAIKWLKREDLQLQILARDTGTYIGGTGLHRIKWSVPKFEIGYWVRDGYSGRGIAQEATVAVARFAFEALGANRVEIRCDAANKRSAAIPRKLGFVHEATLANEAVDARTGKPVDTLVFARTSTEGLPNLEVNW